MSDSMLPKQTNYPEAALQIPSILLPKEDVDMYSWAVVACDQYTSQPAYWQEVEKIVDKSPSTYKLMLPEIYLESDDVDQRIQTINKTMEEYLSKGILKETAPQFILVKRTTKVKDPEGNIRETNRTGLITALDLECYDYNKGSSSLIRATEGTVTERIPPRMKIRKNATLEMPHVMILIDDPENTVIEKAYQSVIESKASPIYDTDLMQNGGHIIGYAVNDSQIQNEIAEGLKALGDHEAFCEKYQVSQDTPVLLYAVGDGNHSLASAKCHYEELKKNNPELDIENCPARYALVELVNVHNEGIIFEPIHRVLFNIDADDFMDELMSFYPEQSGVSYLLKDDVDEDEEPLTNEEVFDMIENMDYDEEDEEDSEDEEINKMFEEAHTIRFCNTDIAGIMYIDRKIHTLAVGAIQQFIDNYLKDHPEVKIDYIHGQDTVYELSEAGNNLGILLPAMEKKDLFPTVIKNGVLPRKTFSMGEACEKRFYLECRRI